MQDRPYKNAYVGSFRELMVYQKTIAAEATIFDLSKAFPAAERYALTDQIRRSSRSIGAQIAEAWGKRRYKAHFVSKLTDADAEQLETQHWLDVAERCGLAERSTLEPIRILLAKVGRMLNGMMLKASSFCQEDTRCVREPSQSDLVPEHWPQVTGHEP